jgi:hypothetical protein
MTNPITNAALAKAAEAVLFDLKDRKGVGNEIEQCDADVQAEIGRTVAAKAIAAFLRALPDLSVCPRLACNYNGSGDSSATLADVVLAAAKDQSND